MFDDEQQRRLAWGGFCATSLIVLMAVYGVLQERILATSQESYSLPLFLIMCCFRVCTMCFAAVMLWQSKGDWGTKAPAWKYVLIALANTLGSSLQMLSMHHLAYHVQMLGKSSQIIPVMMWSMFLSSKSYSMRDWAIAVTVLAGVVQFMNAGPIATSAQMAEEPQNSAWKGLVFTLLAVVVQSLTPAMQEHLFEAYSVPKFNLIFWVNLFASLMVLAPLLATQSLLPAWYFLAAAPAQRTDVLIMSGCKTVAQYFIYSQVQDFGAITLVATMNVRQMLVVIICLATTSSTITILQVFSMFLIIVVLLWRGYTAVMDEDVEDTRGEKMFLVPKLDLEKSVEDSQSPSKTA